MNFPRVPPAELRSDDIFRSECVYEWKCHRYASDDPHRNSRAGIMTVREYRAHNRPSLYRLEVQPWMSSRLDFYYALPGCVLVGPFNRREACEAALRVAAPMEILP